MPKSVWLMCLCWSSATSKHCFIYLFFYIQITIVLNSQICPLMSWQTSDMVYVLRFCLTPLYCHWWLIEMNQRVKHSLQVSVRAPLYTVWVCMCMYHCVNLALCPSPHFRLSAFPYRLPDTASPASSSL